MSYLSLPGQTPAAPARTQHPAHVRAVTSLQGHGPLLRRRSLGHRLWGLAHRSILSEGAVFFHFTLSPFGDAGSPGSTCSQVSAGALPLMASLAAQQVDTRASSREGTCK